MISDILNEIPLNEYPNDVILFIEKFEKMNLDEIADSDEAYDEFKKLNECSKEIIAHIYFQSLLQVFTKYVNVRGLILRCENDG